MLAFLFCFAWAVIVLCPGSMAGKWLRKLLVEMPVERLPHFTARSIAIVSLLAFFLVVLTGMVRGDTLAIVGQGYPDAVMWLTAVDVTTSLDLIVLAWLLSAQLRLRAVVRTVRSLIDQVVLRVIGTTRARSTFRETKRSGRKPIHPANDDPERWKGPILGSAVAA